MICYKTGLAAILNVDLWVDWATIATPIIAVFAISFAYLQLKTSREDSRRSSAYAAYDSYLQLCLDKPKLSYGYDASCNFSNEEYDQYRWFVMKMLFTFEQVLDVYKNDCEWNKAILAQLRKHKLHLSKSRSVQRNEWSRELTALIQKSLL